MAFLRRSKKWDSPTLIDQFLLSPLTYLFAIIHHILTRLRGAPFTPPTNKPPVRVVCISDTHGHTPQIPDGDLLIHAGDLTNSGRKDDIQKAVDWLNTMPHRHIVCIAGNHDNYLDPSSPERMSERRGSTTKGQWSGKGIKWGRIIYLHNTSTLLRFKGGRQLEVYGAPGIPYIGEGHAFQYEEGHEPWTHHPVPPNADILVTHTPPAGHLDIGLGCPSLLREIWHVKPRLHVFGHVHSGHGRETVFWDSAQRAIEALKTSDAAYEQDDKVRVGFFRDLKPARLVEAWRVWWGGLRGLMWRYLMQGPRGMYGGTLVNAALTYQSTSRIGNQAQVVYL